MNRSGFVRHGRSDLVASNDLLFFLYEVGGDAGWSFFSVESLLLPLICVVGLWCWVGNEAFCNRAFHRGFGEHG